MDKKHEVLISLGSNYNAEANMEKAQTNMRKNFTEVKFSRILSTEPIGMSGPNFLNCLCRLHTSFSQESMLKLSKQLEKELGDSKQLRQQGQVVIDIDILSYDNIRLHVSDWQRPYINVLLSDIEE